MSDSQTPADEVGALFGALASPRRELDTIELDEVGRLLRREPPLPFTEDDEREIIRTRPRPVIIWSKCTRCGHRCQGLASGSHPITRRFGHYCYDCWTSNQPTEPDEAGQMTFEV